MPKKSLTSFFEDFIDKESIFLERKALLTSFTPNNILYRDSEIKQIANILAPALKGDRPSNVFVYGNTGTGKTVTIRHITEQMATVAEEKQIDIKAIYVNCKLKKIADTEYRLITHLATHFGRTLPPTGLPTDEVYSVFYESVEKTKGIILLVLDEVDQLVKRAGDDVLYNLTRSNEELQNTQICIVGISNDTLFADNIDVRVKSSLSEESIFFSPYNALQMQNILRDRAKIAFKEDAIEPGVIEKCAAYAAREYGDARKAIELLRVSGELAERSDENSVALSHIDEAQQKLEREKIFDIIKQQPKQFQAALYSILTLKSTTDSLHSGEMYETYTKVCFKTGLRPLTQRRVSDIIKEFEQMGIIHTRTISKGRYGRAREISLAISHSLRPQTKKILEESLELQ